VVEQTDFTGIATGVNSHFIFINESSKSVKVVFNQGGVDTSLNPGESSLNPIDLTNNPSGFVSNVLMSYKDGPKDDSNLEWIPFFSPNWPVGSISTNGRRLSAVNFVSIGEQLGYSSVISLMSRDAKITPHASGTLEYPGLPQESVTSEYDQKYMAIGSEEWRKIVIKIYPPQQHFTYSKGYRLNLGTDTTGDAAPQTGWMAQTQSGGTLAALTIPTDGKIEILATDTNLYPQLTSPEGLVLFIKRDASVDQAHILRLDVLPIVETNNPVRLGSLNILPLDIFADTNRDGIIGPAEDLLGKGEWSDELGAIYSVNFDRDNTRQHSTNGAIYSDAITWWNQSGVPVDEDWNIENEEDVADITPFQIHIGAFPTGTKVYLTIHELEDVHAIHVFPRRKASQTAIWGGYLENGRPWTDGDVNPLDIEITKWLKPLPGETGYQSGLSELVAGSYEFGLEGLVFRGMPVPHGTLENGKFSGIIDLGIEIELPGTTDRTYGGSIRLKVAPFLLTHNDRPTPRVFVADEPDGLQSMPNAHVVADKFPNQWLQDHAEIGYTQRPGGPIIRTALLLPREGALPQWPLYDFLSNDRAVFTLGNNLGGGGGDFGGNVELSCPMPGHPLGRVLAGNSMGETLQQFLAHQEEQQPLIINVDHTEVQHVDEILSPGPGGVTYIPDPAAAITLLQQTFDTPEKQRDALLFSQDTLRPLAATVWRSAFSPETKFLITDLDHDAVISQWERLLVENGGYLRLVGGTSGGQVAKIKALTKATTGDANKITGNDNPDGKLMIEVEHFYDTGAVALTNWKATKPNRPGSWYRTPQQGARIVCVQKTLRWTQLSTTPAIISVWEVLKDDNFVAFNSTTLPALIQASITAAGIGNTVGLPALFYRDTRGANSTDPPTEFGIAYTPNTANLQWVNSSPVHPIPFGPRTANSEDVLRSRIEELSPGNPEFLDSWSKFHVRNGEVHCGSNAERIPTASWWTQISTQPQP
jgi:hypothetical protein